MYWNSVPLDDPVVALAINRNMRCIEIAGWVDKLEGGHPINRNMRCIEMRSMVWRSISVYGLIETWDVLKCENVLLKELLV